MQKFITILTLLAICTMLTGCGKDSALRSSAAGMGTTSSTIASVTEDSTVGIESTISSVESAITISNISTPDTSAQEQGIVAIPSDDINK